MIQKLEEDVALLGSCLLSVPRPSQTHPSQQCMQPARFRNYAGNSPKGKQGKHPDTFATPCSDQHSVGKLPPRSSWAHLQATLVALRLFLVSTARHAGKIYMASLPIHLLTPERAGKERGTSSTAQGGGGSFKNRKPIGELGCCESGMAERSH